MSKSKPSELISRVEVIKLLERRRQASAEELAAAITNKQWSKVATLDGIDTGLLMAAKLVREEGPVR